MARYVGGPCDGLPLDDSFTEPRVCGGVTYVRGAGGNYRPDTSTAGPVGVDALGSHGPRGWADLQRAVNVSIPTATSRANLLTRAAHRKLVQRRKLR